MSTGRRRRVVSAQRELRGDATKPPEFRWGPVPTPGTTEPPAHAQGPHAMSTVRAARVLPRDQTRSQREEVNPLDPEYGVFLGPAPQPDPIAREKASDDPWKGLRGLEDGAPDPRSRIQLEREEHMTAPAGHGALGQPTRDGAGREWDGGNRPRLSHVVPRALVGSEQKPTLDRLRTDLLHRRDGGRWLRRPDAEQDRAGGVGGNEEAPGPRVEAQEQLRVAPYCRIHRAAVYIPGGSPAHRIPISDGFPRGVAARPSECGGRPDLADARGGRANDGIGAGEPSLDLVHRDNTSDRFPIEFRRGFTPEHEEGGVRPGV